MNPSQLTLHTVDAVEVTLDIVDLRHLEQIVSSLKKINGVFEVERVMQA